MKAVPWKLIIACIVIGLFAMFALPPIIRLVASAIHTANPVSAVIEQLDKDNAELRKRNADLLIQQDSLNAVLQQAQTLSTVNKDKLDQALLKASRVTGDKVRLQAAVDSLKEKLVGVSSGSGSGSVTDSGIAIDGKYKDNWLSLHTYGRRVLNRSVYDSVRYTFDFKVGDVRVTTEDSFGNHRTIYSIWLESLRDSTDRRYLSNYVVSETYLKPKYKALNLWDLRLFSGGQVVDNLQAALGVSLASYSPAPWRGEDGTFLRFPLILVLSDLKNDHRVAVGASANIGYFAPLIQNLHVFGGYSWGITRSPILGIGVVI